MVYLQTNGAHFYTYPLKVVSMFWTDIIYILEKRISIPQQIKQPW